MADIVSAEKRSQMMSGIRSKNTRPELLIRTGLHSKGFRYSLHDKSLPGTPDVKLKKYKAVIFVHGCFWHRHTCHLATTPSTRTEFWQAKFKKNQETDRRHKKQLEEAGWRICVIWECSLRGRTKKPLEEVLNMCSNWLLSNDNSIEIRGKT